MGEFDCTLTPQYTGSLITGYCVDCPEVPAQAAVPEITTIDYQLGWNSSAYSVASHAGNCYTEFTVPAGSIGVVCGFAPSRIDNHPRNVNYAFYIYSEAGKEYWVIMEGGVNKTTPVVRTTTDKFRIERRGDKVTYFFKDKVYYTSLTRTTATLVVVACMYSANDGVD